VNRTDLPRRPLGTTGLEVSAVGLGGGPLGDASLSEADAHRLLDAALDAGITLLDTAPSYGASEERIGRWLAPHRDRVVVSTKLGYGVPDVPDWTGRAITDGVELARRRLRVDTLDVAHLHSCSREVLEHGEVVDALADAVRRGHVRVAAYSGDDEALGYAVASGRFSSVQLSLNPWDRAALDVVLPACRGRDLGVFAKRALGNAPWRFDEPPEAPDLAELYRRFDVLDLDPGTLDWAELSLRFAAWQPGVSSALVGTRRPERVAAAVAAVARGPLPDEAEHRLTAAWRRHGTGWPGIV
jgi:aryl-alcohol dehydrogenase-like predicted oxidoreductase